MEQNKWLKRFDSRHSLMSIYTALSTFAHKSLGAENKNILVIAKGIKISFYRLSQENEKLKKQWLKVTLNRKKMSGNISFSRQVIDQMDNFLEKLSSIDLVKTNNSALLDCYQEYLQCFRNIYVAYDMSQPEVFEATEIYLKNEIVKIIKDENQALYFLQKLTQPTETHLLTKEELDWLKILKEMLKRKLKGAKIAEILNDKYTKQVISAHSKKYGWLPTLESPFKDSDYYLELLKTDLARLSLKEVEQSIRKIKELPFQVEEKKHRIIKLIYNNHLIVNTTKSMQEMGLLRINLRIAWTKGAYYTKALFRQIGKRLNVNQLDVKFLLPEEVAVCLKGNKKSFLPRIKERKIQYIARLYNGKFQLFTNKDVDRIIKEEGLDQIIVDNDMILKGTPVSPGRVKGRVKIIYSHSNSQKEEIKKMQKGDILVSGSTKPQLIEACHKASAIVTDEGGILSHAAIISRELEIPCVVGTKIATKILKDGDMIEVDAYKGIVKKI